MSEKSIAPLMGITEWHCYYMHFYSTKCGAMEDVVDENIDLHRDGGMDVVVWGAGRATMDYDTKVKGATRTFENGYKGRQRSRPDIAKAMLTPCPLRRAIKRSRERDIPIYVRLCMNRHYTPEMPDVWAKFTERNPHAWVRTISGQMNSQRMCYAYEEVQNERVEVLCEIQRLGADALVLDFARQFPMVLYNEKVTEAFKEKTGVDMMNFYSKNLEDYIPWHQFRSDIMTGFMRKVKEAVTKQEKALGKKCPIIVRVPDSSPYLMLAYSLDVEAWFKEDLIDATMLTPFPDTIEDLNSYPEYHVKIAHKYGKKCYGGLGCLGIITPLISFDDADDDDLKRTNTGFYHPKKAYEIVDRQYKAGVDALSLYQTDDLLRLEYPKEMISEIGNKEIVTKRVNELKGVELNALQEVVGLDWHSYVKLKDGSVPAASINRKVMTINNESMQKNLWL